jgi:hypothetical protein
MPWACTSRLTWVHRAPSSLRKAVRRCRRDDGFGRAAGAVPLRHHPCPRRSQPLGSLPSVGHSADADPWRCPSRRQFRGARVDIKRRQDLSPRLRDHLVDSKGSVGDGFRRRRWDSFSDMFPELPDMRVLDLGGTVDFWLRTTTRPKTVDILNFKPRIEDTPEWIRVIEGDACDPPTPPLKPKYDLVFSNSVIEHVGGHHRRRQFAASVARLADMHWVQTPYRYFPIEPHYLGPGFQFLPVGLRARILTRWPLVHTPPSSFESALRVVFATELIGRAELRYLFPASKIVSERVAGVTKSLTAVKNELGAKG